MAVFDKNDPEQLYRLDRRILEEGTCCLYFQTNVLEEDSYWFQRQGYESYVFDCQSWQSEDDFHAAMIDTFHFPHFRVGPFWLDI